MTKDFTLKKSIFKVVADEQAYVLPNKQIQDKETALRTQIQENALLIKKLRGILEKEYQFAAQITLNSAIEHHSKLLNTLAMESGLPQSTGFLSMAIDNIVSKYISVPMSTISIVTWHIDRLAKSLALSYKRKMENGRKPRRNKLQIGVNMAIPYAGSYGFFMVPEIGYGKDNNTPQQLAIETLANEAIITPLQQLLSASSDENKLKEFFDEWGYHPAEEYEKFLKQLSKHDITMSFYGDSYSFYANKPFADNVLRRMGKYLDATHIEILNGKICGIETLENRSLIKFAPEGHAKIEATYPRDMLEVILKVYEKDVSIKFSHSIEKKNVSRGGIRHSWDVLEIMELA